jgi:nicotinamide-nucleotide amidase
MEVLSMDFSSLESLVVQLGDRLRARGWHLVTAESCTGGLLAAACTSVAGSSDWFERGIVSYGNDAKVELLGVPQALITLHGAVSEEVARAMASGALHAAPAQLAVAITGVAGPGGGTAVKPVGLVWIAWASAQGVQAERLQLSGDRSAVRAQAVRIALQRLCDAAR